MGSWYNVFVENQFFAGKINIKEVSEPFISPPYIIAVGFGFRIWWKSGASFLSESTSVVNAKLIASRYWNENRSKIRDGVDTT